MTKQAEIYVSTDIEADGPIPGPHSMLSFASVAYGPNRTVVGTYTANLQTLPGAEPYPETMAWWQQFPEAWAACRHEPRPPEEVMPEYCAWVESLPGKPIFVAWPASWDFMWVYWYLVRYVGRRPFAEGALDIRSYAMGMRRTPYLKTGKNYLPKRWFDDTPHSHIALDDAKEQGALFLNMVKENTLVG